MSVKFDSIFFCLLLLSERYIFSVSPKRDAPALLASPGWPEGMKSYSTVSWIVTVPQKMEARLMFANLSQPKCGNRHTNIRVQRVGRLEEDYSRREDEMPEEEITVSESFYLNMSNCMPERGEFSVITKITLQKSISKRTFRRVKRLDVGRMFRRITRASSLRLGCSGTSESPWQGWLVQHRNISTTVQDTDIHSRQ